MSHLRFWTGLGILAALMAIPLAAAENPQPWPHKDLMPAAQLNSQLAAVKSGQAVLIQVGFGTMYKMGHIPGSQYAGPGAKPEGLAALEKVVSKLGRGQLIIIYCGCCPWDDCPNIRPAYQKLKAMGFTNLKVLDIPERFGTDWTARGFPTAKGE